MFWITENHFLFVGLFDWGNAETQTSSVSRNWDGFTLVGSRTRKSGTFAPLFDSNIFQKNRRLCLNEKKGQQRNSV